MFDKVKKHREALLVAGIFVAVILAFIAGIKAQTRYQHSIDRARAEVKANIVKVDSTEQGK